MGTENWTLLHVGLSVRNTDKAAEYYESLGGKGSEKTLSENRQRLRMVPGIFCLNGEVRYY